MSEKDRANSEPTHGVAPKPMPVTPSAKTRRPEGLAFDVRLSGSGGRRGLGDKVGGEMTVMDIPGMWRSVRADPAGPPYAGARQQAAGEGITIAVTQQCQTTLPLAGFTADEVTVTVTSHRPGVAAQVSIGANLNSADGSYQGPTTTVGQGQFTAATRSRVRASFAAPGLAIDALPPDR